MALKRKGVRDGTSREAWSTRPSRRQWLLAAKPFALVPKCQQCLYVRANARSRRKSADDRQRIYRVVPDGLVFSIARSRSNVLPQIPLHGRVPPTHFGENRPELELCSNVLANAYSFMQPVVGSDAVAILPPRLRQPASAT